MNFHALYDQGFARVAACTVPAAIADPAANVATILDVARSCAADGAVLALFPELALSAYAIDDLLLQDALLDAVEAAAATLLDASRDIAALLVVGAPLRHAPMGHAGRVYNAALIVHRGRLLGVVPKIHLPNYREFYERRHFASGDGTEGQHITLAGQTAPFGPDLLFTAADLPGFTAHVEICEDFWVPIPPSAEAALAGATVLLNLSGSPITIGKAETRRLLCQSQSARCLAAYLYAAAGAGESTTDLAWDGQGEIYENGVALATTRRFPEAAESAVADIDLDLLRQERARQGTFDDNRRRSRPATGGWRTITFTADPLRRDLGLRRRIERFPFVPADAARLEQDCYEAYNIQVAGLRQRLAATGTKRVVIGISGGLDSTHALVVAARAFDQLDQPRSDILAYTLPGFATGDASKANAIALMQALDVSHHELDIRPAARLMLADLGHPYARGEPVYDTTFENVQAGLRTDYLFRLANHHQGIVLGTGDLSELALGWCTYGVGDQMAHYNVNAGVPKTLIQHLIRWTIASSQFSPETNAVLDRIVSSEISPELIPGDAPQSTEATIGPYALQDFNLYYTLRHGFRPSRIAFLAMHAWQDTYELETIRHWLETFIRRFFGFSQFKRSAMPNGPKVAAGGSLSPRGDWRAPSDGNPRAWLADLARVPEQGRKPVGFAPRTPQQQPEGPGPD